MTVIAVAHKPRASPAVEGDDVAAYAVQLAISNAAHALKALQSIAGYWLDVRTKLALFARRDPAPAERRTRASKLMI